VALGFCAVEVAPLPKLQDQLVGVFVDVSEKFTVRGAVPDVGDAVKLATGAAGAGAVTVIVFVTVVLVPAAFVAVCVTV
jgi:uncharacterized protein YPO0396